MEFTEPELTVFGFQFMESLRLVRSVHEVSDEVSLWLVAFCARYFAAIQRLDVGHTTNYRHKSILQMLIESSILKQGGQLRWYIWEDIIEQFISIEFQNYWNSDELPSAI